MVYGKRLLPADSRDRIVVRIRKDVIDMGAPRDRPRKREPARKDREGSPATPRRRLKTTGDFDFEKDDIFTETVDFGTSPHRIQRNVRNGFRRTASRLYTPNPRLYPREPTVGRKLHQTLRKLSPRVKKEARQRACESPIRKRRKCKARCLVPNPRLYQAPPNRIRVAAAPPLNPLPSWSPPPKTGPQETASQIALRLSQRTIIPFREFFAPAQQPGPVKKQVAKEKSRPGKSRVKNERISPREKIEPVETERYRNTYREELLPETTLFDSPPHSLKTSILKNKNPPSLDAVPYQNYAVPPPKRYIPRSEHFQPKVVFESSSSSTIQYKRARTPPTLAEPAAMAATPHHSATPEDGSDGNDSMSSAPSEYLAEFLSAIMSRKYAEALKYCRLILHYEPHNATARGFYPILRHKLGQDDTAVSTYSTHEGKVQGSYSESGSGSSGLEERNVTRTTESPDGVEDIDETSDSDESDAAEYLASLSLDSSAKSSRSNSPPPCVGSDSGSEESAEAAGATDLKTCWLADDNGNPRPHSRSHKHHHADEDDENDNAASGDHRLLLKDPTLRQLRAQFACSIK